MEAFCERLHRIEVHESRLIRQGERLAAEIRRLHERKEIVHEELRELALSVSSRGEGRRLRVIGREATAILKLTKVPERLVLLDKERLLQALPDGHPAKIEEIVHKVDARKLLEVWKKDRVVPDGAVVAPERDSLSVKFVDPQDDHEPVQEETGTWA